MKGKVTPETAYGQKLIFFPKTGEECAHLQESLIALGFSWAGNGARYVQYQQECLQNGLVLMNGTIYYRTAGDTTAYTACAIDQVDGDYMTPDQRMAEMFGKLSAKIDALSEKVDRIYAELHPELDDMKPRLKKPGGPAL